MLSLVRQDEHFILNSPARWQQVKVLENRSYVVPHAHASGHQNRDVLDLLQFGDCIFGYSSEQGVVEVQPRCHKGVDSPFTRVSVQESPDPANGLNILQRRLTYNIHLGDHGHVGVKHCPKVLYWCDCSNEGVASHYTRQRDLLQLPTWAEEEHLFCCHLA